MHTLEILAYTKGNKFQMNKQSLFRQHTCIAKQAGFMPTYWSVISISLSNNDRTSEGTRVQEDIV